MHTVKSTRIWQDQKSIFIEMRYANVHSMQEVFVPSFLHIAAGLKSASASQVLGYKS